MISTTEKVSISELHKAILQALLYFDVFKYPITEREIYENCNMLTTEKDVNRSLNELLTLGYLKQVKHFYMPLWADVDSVQKRERANKMAIEMMPTALEYSKRAAQLPFVKGLCISGGLSKNYSNEESDVDFFVITKADRLWLCRSLFIIYYKMLPKSKKKYYCLNYFISESDLRIQDENIFVATEISHLIPTFNYSSYLELLQKNVWYKKWYMNKPEKSNINCAEMPKSFLARFVEQCFPGRLGSWLDNRLMDATASRWNKRYASMDRKNFEIQFRSKKNAAKRHEKGYQHKVLVAHEQKMKELEEILQVKLN
ncbi:MAG: hypothetical protein SGJ15_11790 [Bacteroidota bacterium]|nr:hypothetical protein [Bacteroidota bacterium]